MGNRSGVLELAVLGLLHEAPMHGYELRKRVNAQFGWGRVLSFGSLYPCLKAMLRTGLIATEAGTPDGRRPKIVYSITADGKDHFAHAMHDAGPSAWDDDTFGVRFSFFGRTDPATRLRILEGRRARMEERLANFRAAMSRTAERVDAYTLELQRHGLESAEREVRWLNELIDGERRQQQPPDQKPPATPPN
ncbi:MULTISPECIES: PadR family transcriptional regulator [Kribbella]|jgi:DNA-binding PadR family transcriptional regulator|uniref:DNA-binding PadR family transcriptional regulator n=2 Tax=Kribbella TaxID=182639 RepID=A0A7W9MXA9_9ACTN|nr:PadR family transcriptional regulator [Kribbella italica]MBB5839177.1 DNA-binding PadR family transcriptional regulator [Kribbella italica]